MPESRNITPIVITIPITVLSGYLTSKMPAAIAARARKKELCSIFMLYLYYFFVANVLIFGEK
jgi:hypothetical protein